MDSRDGIIDRIYEAALLPGKWNSVLEELAAISGCWGGIIISGRDHIANRTILTDNLQPFHEDATTGDWWSRNTRGIALLALPSTEFHSDADHFSPEDMKSDPLYRDLLWRHGLGYATATHIHVPNGDALILSLERLRADGPVPRELVDRLSVLRPHLARSAMLASRFAFERIESANAAFGMTGMPSAAVDLGGRVIDCNALFARRFDQATIAAGDRLRLSAPEAARVLDDCLKAARAGVGDSPLPSRSIALPRTDTNEAAVLHLVPVTGFARDLFVSAAYFVILTPLDATRLAPAELIQGLFDLTTMEARVARALASGSDIESTAATFGIARETVRAHLKSIFAKTGFSRQTELATAISLVRTLE